MEGVGCVNQLSRFALSLAWRMGMASAPPHIIKQALCVSPCNLGLSIYFPSPPSYMLLPPLATPAHAAAHQTALTNSWFWQHGHVLFALFLCSHVHSCDPHTCCCSQISIDRILGVESMGMMYLHFSHSPPRPPLQPSHLLLLTDQHRQDPGVRQHGHGLLCADVGPQGGGEAD